MITSLENLDRTGAPPLVGIADEVPVVSDIQLNSTAEAPSAEIPGRLFWSVMTGQECGLGIAGGAFSHAE
jgi:hypothetical protein